MKWWGHGRRNLSAAYSRSGARSAQAGQPPVPCRCALQSANGPPHPPASGCGAATDRRLSELFDLRVPPELLFERGLGELFIVRNAGNTLCATALGSLEFAVTQLQVPLIVVMGHEACEAIRAAVSVARGERPIPAMSARCCSRSCPPCSRPSPGLRTCATRRRCAISARSSGNCARKPQPRCSPRRPPDG